MTRSKRGGLIGRLVAVMEANSRALKAARADADIILAYDAVIRYVRTERVDLGPTVSVNVKESEALPQSDEEISHLSIEEVSTLLDREDLRRSQLEQLAIYRFGVPKGSMRKWSRKEDLRDKILTMLENERKHRAIGEVARSNRGLTPE